MMNINCRGILPVTCAFVLKYHCTSWEVALTPKVQAELLATEYKITVIYQTL